MAEKAYSRITAYCRLPEAEENQVADAAMVLDAWSFVDVAKRLWSVIHNTPGLVHGPAYEIFVRETDCLVSFRHYVQHLEDETRDVARSGRPIWGSFSWGRFHPDKTFEIRVYVPGRLAKVQGIPAVNPGGREIHDDVDHFEMTVGTETLNISDLARKLAAFQKRFEAALCSAPSRGNGDDAILILDLDNAAVNGKTKVTKVTNGVTNGVTH